MVIETLGAIAEIEMGQSPLGETCNNAGLGLPLLNGPTEFGTYHPAPVQFTTDARKRAQPGDILFCVRGSTTGRMNWADREYAIGRGIAAIRHKKGRTFQPFLKALIEYRLSELLIQATGSTFPNVSFPLLAGLSCNISSEGEQRAIAHILGTLDDKIEFNWQMNGILESIARAIFKSWFVDFDPVHAKAEGHDPSLPKHIANLFPDSFEEPGLGEIPAGWHVGKIDEIATLNREGLNPGDFPEEVFAHYSIPAFDEGQKPKIELGKSIKSNKLVVVPQSVLLSKLNPRIRRVWLPCVYGLRRAVSSTEFLVALPKPNVTRELLYCLFSSDMFTKIFTTLITGTSGNHQRVKPESLLQIEVVIAPKPVIQHFTAAAGPMLERVNQNIQQSTTLAAIRDALLPKLLSGEIRVKEAEKFIGRIV